MADLVTISEEPIVRDNDTIDTNEGLKSKTELTTSPVVKEDDISDTETIELSDEDVESRDGVCGYDSDSDTGFDDSDEPYVFPLESLALFGLGFITGFIIFKIITTP